MKRVRLFDNESQFEAMKNEFLNPQEPHVAYTKDTQLVYITPLEEVIYSELSVIVTYTSSEDDKQNWFKAAGETITPKISYHYESLTSDGNMVSISGSTDNPHASAKVQFSGEGVNATDGTVTALSKGSDISNKTKVTDVTCTVEINGKVGSTTISLYQEPNYIIETSYGAPGGLTLGFNTIPASGGSISEGNIMGTITQNRTDIYNSDEVVVTKLRDLVPTSSGWSEPVSAESLNDSVTVKRIVGQLYLEFVVNGETGRAWNDVMQDANLLLSDQTTYGEPYGLSLSNVKTIPAKGGTVSSATIVGTCKQVKYEYYTSDPSKAYETVLTNITYDGSFNKVTASSLGTESKEETLIGELVYSYTSANGGSNTTKAEVYQAKNEISATTYNEQFKDVVKGKISNCIIPAKGGECISTAANGTQEVWSSNTYTWSSGEKTADEFTYARTETITPTRTSLTASATTRGTEVGEEIVISSGSTSWNGKGNKSASDTLYVYQAKNEVTNEEKSYKVAAGSLTHGYIEASGGSATATAGKGYYTATTVTTYSSEKTSTSNDTGRVDPDITRFTREANSKGCVASKETTVGEQRITWQYNTASTTANLIIYQKKNEIVNTKNGTDTSNKTYGEITAGTITNGYIHAGGGSATATAGDGTQSYTYTTTPYTIDVYTSGSESDKKYGTPTTHSGSVSIKPNESSLTATASTRGTVSGEVKTISSITVSWTNEGKSATKKMNVYQEKNDFWYSGGGWSNADAHDTLTKCRDYYVNNNVAITFSSGSETPISPSDFVWTCDGDIKGSGYGTSGNFCPNNPYSGMGSGHIEVKTPDGKYYIATATVTVQQ